MGGPFILLDPKFGESLMKGIIQGLVPRVGLGITSAIQVVQENSCLIFKTDDFKRIGSRENSAVPIVVRAAG